MIVYFSNLPDHRCMKILAYILFIFLSGCTTKPTPEISSANTISISEINPNKWTALTRQNLEQLIQVYDLNPVIFTREIQIESRVIPHSHPILTLNSRYAEQPNKILSSFVHEQLHWWGMKRKVAMDKAILDLKKLFPVLPKTGLAKDENSTYLHLVICFLEYEAMIHYLNRKEANKILKDFIQKDKVYPWIYTQVYLKYKNIDGIVKKYRLSPLPKPVAKPAQKPTKKPPLSSAKPLKKR